MLNPTAPTATRPDAENWDKLEAEMLLSDDYEAWLVSLAPEDESQDYAAW